MTKKIVLLLLAGVMLVGLGACGKSSAKQTSQGTVVIYSNADDEAIDIMKTTLDDNGFKGHYKIQVFGSSDLNAKLMSEKSNLEADVLTLSSFYIESAQANSHPFVDWDTPKNGLLEHSSYQSPILGLEGAIVINKDSLKAGNLPAPHSLKDLANPVYKDQLSFPSLEGSTTGWLMVQALIQTYGQDEAKTILKGMIKNAGSLVTSSGSAPIQNVENGQVAIGYGLRSQGEQDSKTMPVEVVDPSEGNFVLTESVAVLNHKALNPDAKKIAELLATKTRPELIKQYPVALYQNESKTAVETEHVKFFDQPLTVDLLKSHIALFEAAKTAE